MRTSDETIEFSRMLTEARVGTTSPRGHSAMRQFKEGADAKECVELAVKNESQARELWITNALDPWCERHGLTRGQALSIAFDDSSFNPRNPEKDQVTLNTLFAWAGQQNDFAAYLVDEAGLLDTRLSVTVGPHYGVIVKEEGDRIAQDVGRGRIVWHDVVNLRGVVPQVGEKADIQYVNGLGKVKSKAVESGVEL